MATPQVQQTASDVNNSPAMQSCRSSTPTAEKILFESRTLADSPSPQIGAVAASPTSHQKKSSTFEVHMQGALEKQGRLKPWSWKKYWFLLADEHLCYYRNNKKDLSSHRTIDLSKAENVFRLPQKRRGFLFEVTTKSRRHVLVAQTSESCEQWVAAVHKAIVIGRRKLYNLSRGASCDSICDEDALGRSKRSFGSMSSGSTSTNTPSTLSTPSTPGTPPATTFTLSPALLSNLRGASNLLCDSTLTRVKGTEEVGGASSPVREVRFNKTSSSDVALNSVDVTPNNPVDRMHSPLSALDSYDDGVKPPLKRLSRAVQAKQYARATLVAEEDDARVRTNNVVTRSAYAALGDYTSESGGSDLDGDACSRDRGYISSRDSEDVVSCDSEIVSNIITEVLAPVEDSGVLVTGDVTTLAGTALAGCQSCATLVTSDYCSENEAPQSPDDHSSSCSLLQALVALAAREGGRQFVSRFSPIPRMPHPRLEMTWDSPFDGIRVFLAQTREASEVFSVQRRRSDKLGFAIAQLRQLLRSLEHEDDDDEVLLSTRL